ncbi:hypothetical protein [Streptomyces sp. bgisy027]|uniref:hypothetical protein n=1 Tax=Streptomyces sp. bgisy027 TaxID=3413770 RepID=UPI003D706784
MLQLSAILSNPSETTVLVTGASALVTGSLGTFAAIHQKKVLAWAKRLRRHDDDIAELTDRSQALKALYEEQARLARTPAYAADFAEITRLTNTISGRIEHTPRISAELQRVVECAQSYIDTALPEPPVTARIPYPDAQRLLVMAMRQEFARVVLERAINAADQKITDLRRI